jgi:hypothetical protein
MMGESSEVSPRHNGPIAAAATIKVGGGVCGIGGMDHGIGGCVGGRGCGQGGHQLPFCNAIPGLCCFQEMKFFLPLLGLLSWIRPSLCLEIRMYLPTVR